MPLAADIGKLRDDIVAELNAVHDYFTNTKHAWRIVQRAIARGTRISIRNLSTGTVMDETSLPGVAQRYVTEYLAEATFQQSISLFEEFVFGLMRLWLLKFPQTLGARQVAGSVILEASDLDTVKQSLVDGRLNEVRYQKVRDWFRELERMVILNCPSFDQIDRIAEIKASRDVLVHNRGMANRIYEEKAGPSKRYTAGQKVSLPERYHRESWELIRKLVTDLAEAAITKAPD